MKGLTVVFCLMQSFGHMHINEFVEHAHRFQVFTLFRVQKLLVCYMLTLWLWWRCMCIANAESLSRLCCAE